MITLKADFSDKILDSNYSIFIAFPYNPNYVNLVKQLNKRVWNGNSKLWEVPYSSYTELVTLLNNNQIPYNAQEFLDSIQELSNKVEKMQSASTVDIDISELDNIDFKTTPLSYQKEGIIYGLKHPKFLLADQPGLGKTLSSSNIACLSKTSKHCLVIVGYTSLLFNWVKEIATHTHEKGYVIGQRKTKRGKIVSGKLVDRLYDIQHLDEIEEYFVITDVTTLRQCEKEEYIKKNGKKGVNKRFTNAELLEAWCKKGDIDCIIVDESHVAKNFDSDQTQALLQLRTCPRKIAMTGTPIMNQNLDLYPIMVWLGQETRNFWEFRDRYCILGGFKGKDVVGNKNTNELHKNLSNFMLRRLKDEVLDLPDKIFKDELLEMDGKQWATYETTHLMYKNLLEDIGKNKNLLLTKTMNLRKITYHPNWYEPDTCKNSVKLDRALQIIQEAVANGEKTIIYSSFTTPFESEDECVNIYNRLQKFNPAMIIGATKDRMTEIEKFQKDPTCMVMVGSIGAMGVGITLNEASNVIFLDEPWNKAIKDQAIDRAHRVGTKHTVVVYTLMCKGTIDEGVHRIVTKKGRIADEIIDGVSTEELIGLLKDF